MIRHVIHDKDFVVVSLAKLLSKVHLNSLLVSGKKSGLSWNINSKFFYLIVVYSRTCYQFYLVANLLWSLYRHFNIVVVNSLGFNTNLQHMNIFNFFFNLFEHLVLIVHDANDPIRADVPLNTIQTCYQLFRKVFILHVIMLVSNVCLYTYVTRMWS